MESPAAEATAPAGLATVAAAAMALGSAAALAAVTVEEGSVGGAESRARVAGQVEAWGEAGLADTAAGSAASLADWEGVA